MNEDTPTDNQATAGEDTDETTNVEGRLNTTNNSHNQASDCDNESNMHKDSNDVCHPRTDSAGSHGDRNIDSESSVETAERVQYCVIETGDGEVED